jgi:hypothetical protein
MDVQRWLRRVIKERIDLEEAALGELKRDLATKNGNLRVQDQEGPAGNDLTPLEREARWVKKEKAQKPRNLKVAATFQKRNRSSQVEIKKI